MDKQTFGEWADAILAQIYEEGAVAWPPNAVPQWRHMTEAQRREWRFFINEEFSLAREEQKISRP